MTLMHCDKCGTVHPVYRDCPPAMTKREMLGVMVVIVGFIVLLIHWLTR